MRWISVAATARQPLNSEKSNVELKLPMLFNGDIFCSLRGKGGSDQQTGI